MSEAFAKTGTFDWLQILLFAKGVACLLFKNFLFLFPYLQVKKCVNTRKHQSLFFFMIHPFPWKGELPPSFYLTCKRRAVFRFLIFFFNEEKVDERAFTSVLTLLNFPFCSMEEEKRRQNIPPHTLCCERKGFREHTTGVNPFRKCAFFPPPEYFSLRERQV